MGRCGVPNDLIAFCSSKITYSITTNAFLQLDVRRGIEYLHSLALQSFIHRGLKQSNIILGDDMRAKVADFGLVKNTPDGNCEKFSVETKVAGTFGYLAREYAALYQSVSHSFESSEINNPDERCHLVSWFKMVWNHGHLNNTLVKLSSFLRVANIKLQIDCMYMAPLQGVISMDENTMPQSPIQVWNHGHLNNTLVKLSSFVRVADIKLEIDWISVTRSTVVDFKSNSFYLTYFWWHILRPWRTTCTGLEGQVVRDQLVGLLSSPQGVISMDENTMPQSPIQFSEFPWAYDIEEDWSALLKEVERGSCSGKKPAFNVCGLPDF
ncbi:receptor-like kinase [Artemisia annua]|uniref:Receptor-like kinase n=1 Tax=Artemisia annua TaxID=35608 RepID=A0A2U1PS41_ARTAN|nr:receptor-like kinase [Artemisia annua]